MPELFEREESIVRESKEGNVKLRGEEVREIEDT